MPSALVLVYPCSPHRSHSPTLPPPHARAHLLILFHSDFSPFLRSSSCPFALPATLLPPYLIFPGRKKVETKGG